MTTAFGTLSFPFTYAGFKGSCQKTEYLATIVNFQLLAIGSEIKMLIYIFALGKNYFDYLFNIIR